MTQGVSLHIGLNRTDPNYYDNLQELLGPVNDAGFMHKFSSKVLGFDRCRKLLNEEASYEQVLFTIREAGREIQPGDIFLLSYSGHGSQIINEYYHEEDEEYHDQTWCLFDRMLIDDELREAFKGFAPGARILVISDSCFSGTITRVEEGAGQDFPAKSQREEWAFQQALRQMMNKFDMKDKALPAEIAKLLQQQHHETFQAVQDDIRKEKENGSVKACVKLFAACQDSQIALDASSDDGYGRFTSILHHLLLKGKGRHMNSQQLWKALKTPFSFPTPNYDTYGVEIEAWEKAGVFNKTC